MTVSFHNVRFPTDVSYGSSGGPVFKTQVFTSDRGYEKRNIEWCQPLMKFNVAYGIRTDEQMIDVLEFFNARQGRANGFRYKNWGNYSIVNTPFATGDGISNRLAIWKFYGFQGVRTYKRLRKIVPGSVIGVGIGGVGNLVEGVDYSINYDEGEIALNTAPGYGVPVYCANLEFDEAVTFEDDNIQSVIDQFNSQSLNSLNLMTIRGPFTSGSVFQPDADNMDPDPLFEKTYLILNFDDITDTDTTVDQSNLGMPIVFNGTASLDATTYKNGNGSLSFGDGSVTTTGGPFDFSPGQPFSIEVFAQQPDTSSNNQEQIIGKWDESTDNRCWVLRYMPATRELQFVTSTDGVDENILITFPWTTGTVGDFDYLTIDRLTNNWYVMRINGEVVGQIQYTGSTHNSSSALLSMGRIVNPTAGQGTYGGRVDAVRITVGQARNTTFGTVPIPGPYSVSS